MRHLILILLLLFYIPISIVKSQDLSKPTGIGTMKITTIQVDEESSLMNFEGNIGEYGKVFASFTLWPSDSNKDSGVLEGHARTILEDGTFLHSPLNGSWKRKKGNLKFFFTDNVNNGAMNFVIWDVNMLSKETAVRYYSLLD